MSSTPDWIDELDNEEDLKSYYEEWKSAIGKSRYKYENGWIDACLYFLAKVKDDERTDLDTGPLSSEDASHLVKAKFGELELSLYRNEVYLYKLSKAYEIAKRSLTGVSDKDLKERLKEIREVTFQKEHIKKISG